MKCPICGELLSDRLLSLENIGFRINRTGFSDKDKALVKEGKVSGYFSCDKCDVWFIIFPNNKSYIWNYKNKGLIWFPFRKMKIVNSNWRIA